MKPQIQAGFERVALDLVRVLGRGGECVLLLLPGFDEVCAFAEVTDGVVTPDPNPRNLVNWCF